MAKNEYMGNVVGKAISRVEEVDLENGEMAWGEFMRVRVHVDVTKPLLRGKKINLGLTIQCGLVSHMRGFKIFAMHVAC